MCDFKCEFLCTLNYFYVYTLSVCPQLFLYALSVCLGHPKIHYYSCSFGNMLNSFQSVIETLVQVLSLPYVKAESLGIGQREEDLSAAIAPGVNGSLSLVMCIFSSAVCSCPASSVQQSLL